MKKLLILIPVILFVTSLQAQKSDEDRKLPHMEKRYTVSLQPAWWFNNAFRFDFEMRIKDTPVWIQVSPVIHYLANMHKSYNDYWDKHVMLLSGDELNSLFGYGIELNYKYFFNKKESLYVAGGCSFVHHNVKYYDNYWNTYTENGLTYHIPEYGVVWQRINKLGLNTYFGYQIPNRRSFLCDMFVGLGFRKSFHTNSTAQLFDYGMLSPGYTGLVLMTGIRLGVKFK